MILVGLMSGTSLDGMDAAVVRVTGPTHVELIGFAHRPYSIEERGRIFGWRAWTIAGGIGEVADLRHRRAVDGRAGRGLGRRRQQRAAQITEATGYALD